MTDDSRKISVGLAPRKRPQGAANVLSAESRKAAPTPEPDAETAIPPAETPTPRPAAAKRPKKTAAAKRQPSAGKVQIAADVPADTRGRARAAFRFAQFYDRVPTFSEFVTNALEAEIRRIEQLHNNGERLEPETENLPAGRPSSR